MIATKKYIGKLIERSKNLIPWFVSLITVLIYYPGLKGQFIIDDETYLDNGLLTKSSIYNPLEIFEKSTNYWGEHLPLRDYLLLIEYNLFENSTLGYHVVSLILFLATAWVLYHWIKELSYDHFKQGNYDIDRDHYSKIAAIFVMGCFLFHPMYVESVAYISGQKDILSGFFILLSIRYLYNAIQVKDGTFWRLLFIGTLFHYLAVLSKFSALATTFFIPLLWVIIHNKITKQLLYRIGIWFIVNLPVLVWVNYAIHFSTQAVIKSTPLMERIPRAITILGNHLYRSIWPSPMSFGYPFDKEWSVDEYFIIGLVFVIITGVIVIFFRRKFPIVVLGLVLFMAYLTPVLSIYPELLNDVLFDRYLVVPLIGLFLVFTYFLFQLYLNWHRIKLWMIFISVLGIWSFYLLLTINYIPNYNNNSKIRELNFKAHPNWPEATFVYTQILMANKEYLKAEFIIKNMDPKIHPDYAIEYLLGSIYFLRGDIKRAEPLLISSAIKSDKNGWYPYAKIHLANIFYIRKDYSNAKNMLLELLDNKLKPPVETKLAKELLQRMIENR